MCHAFSPFLYSIWVSLLTAPLSVLGASERCSDAGLDWYNNAVGETPCQTYERLRRICNPSYTVPESLKDAEPQDRCTDPNAECCCNNIAFSLRMLCFTCQMGLGEYGFGVDAQKGTYQMYLAQGSNEGECEPQSFQALPMTVQEEACSRNMRIFRGLYDGTFWKEGSWFYLWSNEYLSQQLSTQGEQAFYPCFGNIGTSISTSIATTDLNPTVSPTSESSSSGAMSMSKGNSKFPEGAIAGIVIGVVIAVAGIGLAIWWYFWKYRRGEQDSKVFDRGTIVPPSPGPTGAVGGRFGPIRERNGYEYAPVVATGRPSMVDPLASNSSSPQVVRNVSETRIPGKGGRSGGYEGVDYRGVDFGYSMREKSGW
ncbi:hypothetical protein L218DRAFT_493490 [Marasmius fiardii PR-910]|nr:hypothetical protein L218DRAFT_493490 [Marasmius fiardii PR-910]